MVFTFCFLSELLFFLIIDLYFLIAAVITQIPQIQLLHKSYCRIVTPIGIPSKEAKAEIETHPVIAEAKLRKCLI